MKVNLTFNELFFIGDLLKAKYIDYTYLEKMSDIDINYDLMKNEITESLIQKNIIKQNFSGDFIVDNNIKELLLPIFFAENEVELSYINKNNGNSCAYTKKIHYSHDNYSVVEIDKTQVCVTDELNNKQIENDLFPLLEKNNIQNREVQKDEFNKDKYIAFLCIKNVNNLQQKTPDYYFICADKTYKYVDSSKFLLLNNEELKNILNNVLLIKEEY